MNPFWLKSIVALLILTRETFYSLRIKKNSRKDKTRKINNRYLIKDEKKPFFNKKEKVSTHYVPATNHYHSSSGIYSSGRFLDLTEMRSLKEESCSEGMLVSVEVVTNSLSVALFDAWDIVKTSSREVVWSSGFYGEEFTLFNETRCLEKGAYKFTYQNSNRFGVLDGAYLKLRANGSTIKELAGPLPFTTHFATFGSCTSDVDCNDKDMCTIDKCNINEGQCSYEYTKEKSPFCRSFGNQNLTYVLIVSANDAVNTLSREDIGKAIFGLEGSNFSMSSQFADCSDEKFTFTPWLGNTIFGQPVQDGIVDLHLPINVTGAPIRTVATAILNEALATIPNIIEGDFLIACLPPGIVVGSSNNWKAFAFVNDRRSFYNDKACTFPSVLMHELGHNLGLAHSNDEFNYGDETGMMGLSYFKVDGPRKCFNGPKSWDLGWFADSHLLIDSKNLQLTSVHDLVGFVDYKFRSQRYTIIKLINSGDDYDYYISFNRKIRENSDTEEGENKVLVAKRPTGYLYEDSTLIGRLGNESLTLCHFDGAYKLRITSLLHLDFPVPFATIVFLRYTSFCEEKCDDGNSCTTDICLRYNGIKMCEHKERDCGECGAKCIVQITANNSPEKVTWKIVDTNTQQVVRSSGYYSDPYTSYVSSECMEYGKYKFFIDYSDNSTYSDEVQVTVQIDDFIFIEGRLQGIDNIEGNFLICFSDDDCENYDGCARSYCDPVLKICQNEITEDENLCNDCTWLELEVVTDAYPEETSWVLSHSEKAIMSGDPYAIYELRNGRKKAPTKVRYKIFSRSVNNGRLLFDGISERICLKNGHTYDFEISDSFGDGMCCAEGMGYYALFINDELLLKGGQFSEHEEISFAYHNCTSDLSCDDGNSCTVDKCISTLPLCIHTILPCEECGAWVTFLVATDRFPEQNSWSVTNGHKSAVKGPYAAAKKDYLTCECLSYGTHEFSIFDSGANGMTWCCEFLSLSPQEIITCIAEKRCGYSIAIGNETLIEGEPDFGALKLSHIGICYDDTHCNDQDSCTRDYCNTRRNICVFAPLPCIECSNDPCDRTSSCIDPLPCSECNETLATFEMNTDFYPPYTWWLISNTQSNVTVMSGGHYTNILSYYEHEQCLPAGKYKLFVGDLGVGVGAGIEYCRHENAYCGNYVFRLDGDVSFKGNRSMNFENIYNFDLNDPSTLPSTSSLPTLSPSWIQTHKTLIPTIYDKETTSRPESTSRREKKKENRRKTKSKKAKTKKKKKSKNKESSKERSKKRKKTINDKKKRIPISF